MHPRFPLPCMLPSPARSLTSPTRTGLSGPNDQLSVVRRAVSYIPPLPLRSLSFHPQARGLSDVSGFKIADKLQHGCWAAAAWHAAKLRLRSVVGLGLRAECTRQMKYGPPLYLSCPRCLAVCHSSHRPASSSFIPCPSRRPPVTVPSRPYEHPVGKR